MFKNSFIKTLEVTDIYRVDEVDIIDNITKALPTNKVLKTNN
jgi:hypothetical protein